MSNRKARLVSAISDAMEAQEISQNALSRKTCVNQSTISRALRGIVNPNEEKWRMLCETLGLNYDEIIEDPEPIGEGETKEDAAQSQREDVACCGNAAEPQKEEEDPVEDEKESEAEEAYSQAKQAVNAVARYIIKNLRADVSRGTDMALDELYILLDFCNTTQDF